MRFRNECEGRSAGSIPGESSTPERKTFPAMKVHNYSGPAEIVVSCVTKDDPYKPHPHNLVGKDCKKGVCTLRIRDTATVTFPHLGIQCAKKKDVEGNLKLRQEINVDPFQMGFKHKGQNIDLNVVRLCFQVFLPDEQGKITGIVKPVVSQAIHDKKALNDLVICQPTSGKAKGGDEVVLLCEKINRDDVRVRFYLEQQGHVVWEAFGDFGQNEVHRQFAIKFKTPPFMDQNIRQPVVVEMQLQRSSDLECSDSIWFTYEPEDPARLEVDGFRQRIVLKELSVDDSPGSRRKDKVHILASVTNEKLASRVMHFAIVPLIAYHDDLEKGKYYFIAPYLEKGDLYAAIQSDRKLLVENPPPAEYIPVLHWKHRLKIMYQIACAIDYLHTGNSFRDTILHMDVKSKNVVIDSELNARLIDFGLAREVKEGVDLQTATPLYGTEGYFPPVQHKRLTPEHDYHNYGIVIRELLTGVDPTEYEKDNDIQLRKWDSRRIENSIHDRVWPKEFNKRRDIRALADTCIDSINNEGTLKSKSICDELKNLMRTNSVSTWTSSNDQRCEICMVNEHDTESPVAEINHKDCPGKIKICHACMRNSYFNPIKCHTCDNDIKAVIGDGWGAVLIAGFDEHNANLFKKDVTAFGDAITSTVLPTMCIRKSNLVVVDFNTKSEESACSRIEKAFKILESNHVHTLVLLYSGHNGSLGFQIGRTSYQDERSEYLFYHMNELCKCINEFNGLEKVIVFFGLLLPKTS